MLMKINELPHGAKACRNSKCDNLAVNTMSCMAYTTARATYRHVGRTAKYWSCIDPIGRFDSLWELDGSCWIWAGRLSGHSRAPYMNGHKGEVFAHRIAYDLHKSDIPDGTTLIRACKQRLCVNPDHHVLVKPI